MLRINNYRVAKYLRLSRDDGDNRESESIENQRDILNNYINEHDDLENAEEYVDDGYTGTNFNRPGFKEMIEDIQDGKISCIITKDLSRFGRDHIDTGYYLERYLPSKNTTNKKKYDYVLNGLIYCGECGNEAIFAHRKSKNWEGSCAVCKKKE